MGIQDYLYYHLIEFPENFDDASESMVNIFFKTLKIKVTKFTQSKRYIAAGP